MTIYRNGVVQALPTIDKGIPFPEKRNAKTGLKRIVLDMDIGDSILVQYSRNSIAYNLARLTGFEFTQRREGEKLRIWRIK